MEEIENGIGQKSTKHTETSSSGLKQKIVTGSVFVLLILLAVGAFGAFFEVGPGEAGVVYDRGSGVLDETYGEGLHFKIPYWQDAAVFTTRTQLYRSTTSAGSNDLQEVETTVALNYHLSKEEVHDIYRKVGPQYEERIIDPAIEETIKAVTAKYDATQLIQDRSSAKEEIDEMLEKRLERNHISVDEVSIEDFQFTEAFDEAIERKEIARQEALEEENRLEAVKMRAEQRREEAQGEADAIATINEQLSQSENYVEWYKVDQWNGETQTITPFVEGNGAGTFLNLPTEPQAE